MLSSVANRSLCGYDAEALNYVSCSETSLKVYKHPLHRSAGLLSQNASYNPLYSDHGPSAESASSISQTEGKNEGNKVLAVKVVGVRKLCFTLHCQSPRESLKSVFSLCRSGTRSPVSPTQAFHLTRAILFLSWKSMGRRFSNRAKDRTSDFYYR